MAAWLKAHPGIEVVSRDRSATYAEASRGAEAEQVADRWHLLKNLREAVERVLERHRRPAPIAGCRPSSRSVRGESTGSSKSMSCTSGVTQPLGNWACRGGPCSATWGVR